MRQALGVYILIHMGGPLDGDVLVLVALIVDMLVASQYAASVAVTDKVPPTCAVRNRGSLFVLVGSCGASLPLSHGTSGMTHQLLRSLVDALFQNPVNSEMTIEH